MEKTSNCSFSNIALIISRWGLKNHSTRIIESTGRWNSSGNHDSIQTRFVSLNFQLPIKLIKHWDSSNITKFLVGVLPKNQKRPRVFILFSICLLFLNSKSRETMNTCHYLIHPKLSKWLISIILLRSEGIFISWDRRSLGK